MDPKFLIWLWVGLRKFLTVVIGLGITLAVVYPASLAWYGISATADQIVFGSRVLAVVGLWFILGDDKYTQAVSNFEKSGPIAYVVIGGFIVLILEGPKIFAALAKAGLTWWNGALLLGGIAFLVFGIVLLVRKYWK